MARQIPLDQIGNYMDGQIRQLVRVTTLEWEGRVKTATPVDTGTLRNAWESRTDKPYVGEVTNIMEYAEPVCYGTSLPPSWDGYKTRQGVTPGFPDLIGKELESWAQQQYQKIVRRG